MTIINIRLEDDLVKRLQKLAEIENLDRTNLIKKLLRKGSKEELMDKSLGLYIRGKLTLEQAARQAEVTPWDLIDLMAQRGIHHRGTPEEFYKHSILKYYKYV